MNAIPAVLLAFFLGQLIPNFVFHTFIFHEIGFWIYSIPVMAVGLISALLLFFRVPTIRDISYLLIAAFTGTLIAYCVELLTYHFRLLHGVWAKDFWVGVGMHGYIFRETIWRQLLPFTIVLMLGHAVSKRKKAEQGA